MGKMKFDVDTIISEINGVLNENHLWADVDDYNLEDHTITYLIEWGDWKHSHLCFDYLIHQKFSNVRIETMVTEEDGSDCYSAIHKIYFDEYK